MSAAALEDRALAELLRLRELNRELVAALRLHQAWSDSERAGPDYGAQTRDTHPNGAAIWNRWWNGNLDLCARAEVATKAALAKCEDPRS